MSNNPPKDVGSARLSLLERREIEARIVGPLIRGFSAEIGEERALAVVRRVIEDLARSSGAELAHAMGDASLSAFAEALERWKEGGALEIEVLTQDTNHLDFNVTRCRYSEMYRALGLADLGGTLSCCRDFALIEGFNPDVTLTRTQTLMEGAAYCDFRFRRREAPLKSPDQDDDPVD